MFRLDQSTEAEFGLFRYFSYFSQGLNEADQLIWRSTISRIFALLIDQSILWNPKNRLISRGQSHFLVYSILTSKLFASIASESESFFAHDRMITDIVTALQSCPETFSYLSIFLQLQLIKQYENFDSEEASKSFVEYLKSEKLLRNWNHLGKYVFNHAKKLYKSVHDADKKALSTWSLACLENRFENFSQFCDDCQNFMTVSKAPIFLNFAYISNKFLFCSVKIAKSLMQIGQENVAHLSIYNNSEDEISIESVGLFFNEQNFDEIVFEIGESLNIKPFSLANLKSSFSSFKAFDVPVSVAFVTMQLKQPYLALQYDRMNFSWSNNISDHLWKCFSSNDGAKFISFANSILKRHLQFTVTKAQPELRLEFALKAKCYRAVPVPLNVTIFNDHNQPACGELSFASELFSIVQDRDGKLLQCPVSFKVDAHSQTNMVFRVKVFESTVLTVSVRIYYILNFINQNLEQKSI